MTSAITSFAQSPSQPLLEELHWLPVRQHIDYKLAVLTYKIRNTSHQTSGIHTSPPFFNHTTTPQSTDQLPELTSLTARSVAPLLPSGTL